MRIFILLVASIFLLGCSASPKTQPSACTCSQNYTPVCGVDNNTYNNSCLADCSGVNVSHDGQCVQCVDSDGGKDPLAKGTASEGGLSYTDYCLNFSSVQEYYCNAGIVSKEAMTCADGYQCIDGACAIPQPPTATACQDSDGGPDPYTRGTVTADQTSYTDSCTADKQLVEYDCAGDQMTQTTGPCPSGSKCDSGRCVRMNIKCVGSNNASDIFNPGDLNVSVNLISMEFLDKCLDNQTLQKYYCVGDDYNTIDVSCPPDYQCLEAACRQIACSDTDNGIDIYHAGTVVKGGQSFRDICTDKNGGVEYYCKSNQVSSAGFNCPDGYYCSDGRCTK